MDCWNPYFHYSFPSLERRKPCLKKSDGKPVVICTTNIAIDTFYVTESNPDRLYFLEKMIPWASANQISCLCFPAGFLLLNSLSESQKLLSKVTRLAFENDVSFILGIDEDKPILRRRPNTPAFLEAVRKQILPAYLYAYNALTDTATTTYQRSCTPTHSYLKLVPDELLAPRIMRLGECEFQIIHCGEVYEPRLFSPGMPKAGIVFGHKSMPRLSRTLNTKSSKGFSLINTEHRWQSGGKLFCFTDGNNLSVKSQNLIDDDDGIWIDIALWRLCKSGHFTPIQIKPSALEIEA